MLRLTLSLVLLAAAPMAQPASYSPLHTFSYSATDDWVTVNDGVMGGKSEGGPAFPGETLVFRGVTDTDGGGFSSIRTRPARLDLGEAEGLWLRYRADGRQYEVEVHTAERARGIPVAFRAPLPVVEGDGWHEARVPFSAFRATAHGRPLPDRRLDAAEAQAIGLFVYDGVSGPFRLEVDEIGSYGTD